MKIVVFNNLTLDGVIQAPMQREEDQSGGFELGGWAAPYNAMQSREAGESLSSFGSLLMGRRTYEIFSDYYPKHPENPFTDTLTTMQKYVASTTLREPLPWKNSTLLKGDVPQAVTALKAQPGDDIIVWGSSILIQTLIRHNLIDRYILLIHPFVLGSGRRLFPDGGEPTQLHLVSAKATDNGVAVVTYEPNDSSQNQR
jgi:dihydrofolate reductase